MAAPEEEGEAEGEGAGLSDLCAVLVEWAVAGAEALGVALALPESSQHEALLAAPASE